jgi:hypothetical protein
MMSHNTSVELSEQQENLNQSIMHMHNTAIYCVRYHYAIVYYEILDLFWIFIVSCGLYMCIEKWNLRTRGNARAFILVTYDGWRRERERERSMKYELWSSLGDNDKKYFDWCLLANLYYWMGVIVSLSTEKLDVIFFVPEVIVSLIVVIWLILEINFWLYFPK